MFGDILVIVNVTEIYFGCHLYWILFVLDVIVLA